MLKEAQKVFFELDDLLDQTKQIENVFRGSLKRIARSFKVKRVSLMLVDQTRRELFIHESEGLEPELKEQIRVKLGEGISGWVAQKGEGILVRDIERDKQFRREKKESGFRGGSFICIPLKVFGKVYGVLNVSEKKSGEPFQPDELRRLELFGMQLALIVENSSLREKIQALEKRPVEEVAELSHDFRIPLVCVQEVLHLMGSGELGPITAEQREFIELANRNLKRMIATFDHLIDVATRAVDNGPEYKKIELCDLVKSVCRDFEARARRKKVEVAIDIPDESCWAYTDERRLHEVMLNLVDNAVKYTREKTKILLKLESNGKKVRFEVRDHGPGIAEEDKKAIFDKGASVKLSNEKGLAEGHGLGLAISHDIMKSLGGKIGFTSRKNQGTVFYIELPKTKTEMAKNSGKPRRLVKRG